MCVRNCFMYKSIDSWSIGKNNREKMENKQVENKNVSHQFFVLLKMFV